MPTCSSKRETRVEKCINARKTSSIRNYSKKKSKMPDRHSILYLSKLPTVWHLYFNHYPRQFNSADITSASVKNETKTPICFSNIRKTIDVTQCGTVKKNKTVEEQKHLFTAVRYRMKPAPKLHVNPLATELLHSEWWLQAEGQGSWLSNSQANEEFELKCWWGTHNHVGQIDTGWERISESLTVQDLGEISKGNGSTSIKSARLKGRFSYVDFGPTMYGVYTWLYCWALPVGSGLVSH